MISLKVTRLVCLELQEKKWLPKELCESVKEHDVMGKYVTKQCKKNSNIRSSNLFQYHNNVSFPQIQLILRFGFVVKHDLATLRH